MSGVPSGVSPRTKRISTPKQKPERDERDTEIDRLEMDNQFLKDLLQKAKIERESLIGKIGHLEQQMKVQDTLVVEAQQQRNSEKAVFRRNVENSRTVLESKYNKTQSAVKDRESLLLLWTEFATATLIENPDSPIRPLLAKTCTSLPEAKDLAGKIYENFVDSAAAGDSAGDSTGEPREEGEEVPKSKPTVKRGAGSTTGYNMLMGNHAASDTNSGVEEGPQSRSMTAALREINREVDGATQKIDALLGEQEDPATDGNTDHNGGDRNATGTILGNTGERSPKGQFLSDGPCSSDEESSRRVTIVEAERSPQGKKTKKKVIKKKKTKGAEGGSGAGAGAGAGAGRKKSPRNNTDYETGVNSGLNRLDQNSSIASSGDRHPDSFWWQGSHGQGGGSSSSRGISPSKQQRDQFGVVDKSISFSDAEINRLLQDLRMQQQQEQQQPQQGTARTTQGKHSMNLSIDNGDDE